MATQAQINANRKNALKSTGPRSKKGKDAVSQNAVKHGLCANKNVIRNESQEEYKLFRDEMIEDLSPCGALEKMLAERIVSLSWRLKRAEHFQNMVIDSLMDYEMTICRPFFSKARREAEAGDFELLMGHVINRDFADSRTLDLLLMYERRIERSLYKTTEELRKLQHIRKEKQSQIKKEYRTHDTEYRIKDEEQLTYDEDSSEMKESDSVKKVCCDEQSQNSGFQPELLNSTLNQKRYRAKSEILNKAETSEFDTEKQTQFELEHRHNSEDINIKQNANVTSDGA